jgi:hypothetical protein
LKSPLFEEQAEPYTVPFPFWEVNEAVRKNIEWHWLM